MIKRFKIIIIIALFGSLYYKSDKWVKSTPKVEVVKSTPKVESEKLRVVKSILLK